MTKEAALYQFFASLGFPAYPVTAVPDDVVYPYTTYTVQMGDWDEQTSLTVNIWTYTDSEAEANENARKLDEAVPYGGAIVPCESGTIWLKRGSPWRNDLNDSSYENAKLRSFNVTAEWNTIY